MKFITKFKKFFSFQAFKDIRMYIEWIKTIKEEEKNPESLYNKFDFSRNLFYVIYTIINLNKLDEDLPEQYRRFRVFDELKPINRYLDEELGFADYLVPEIDQFYDENGNQTLQYGIIYRFAFKRLSLKWIIYRIILISGLIYSFIHFDLINLIKGLF